MLFALSRISTWLLIELIAASALSVLNMMIPILMIFPSFRNMANFYLSSTALSSAFINFLYVFYLIQTCRAKVLSEINCRAIYYLQTSCIVILANTVVAMHANFVLSLFQSLSDQPRSMRTCIQSCGICLKRLFQRISFCSVICVWSFSFTATIPLLYTIDSTEKVPKPVYCPGSTSVSYHEEWFDRDRFMQSMIFNVIPLLMNLFLSSIAILKLLYDCFAYIYSRIKESTCCICKKKSALLQQQQDKSVSTSSRLLPPVNVIGTNTMPDCVNISRTGEIIPSTASFMMSSSNLRAQSFGRWLSRSSLRFLLVLSSSLLACIYPVVMRFYLVYFSAIVPMLFAVLNYSLGNLTLMQQTTVENRTTLGRPLLTANHNDTHDLIGTVYQVKPSIKQNNIESCRQEFELKAPLIMNSLHQKNGSCGTMSTLSANFANDDKSQSLIDDKRTCFSNRLYENTRTISTK